MSSLADFHAAFNSFCKEYFPAENIFEECCNEFSLLHKDSVSHENQICDKASIAEDSSYHEHQEMLNDILYDSNDIETSDIISDVSAVLNVHEDKHVSFEYSDIQEQEYTSAEDISYCGQGIADPQYGINGDSLGSVIDTEGSSCFPDLQIKEDNPQLSHLLIEGICVNRNSSELV